MSKMKVARIFQSLCFEDVEVGHFYILNVRHENNVFTPDTYAFNLLEEQTDIIFQRIWN
jgi:hypothetical protein